MAKTVRPNYSVPSPGHGQLAYWRTRSAAPSFVYVICAGDPGTIKVGKANDPAARIAEFQTGNPVRLELMHVLVGGLDLERELHNMLGFKNRLSGEWFTGPVIPGFLGFVEGLAREMVIWHKNCGSLPDFKRFPPFSERAQGGPGRITDAQLAHRGRLSSAVLKPTGDPDLDRRRFRAAHEIQPFTPHRSSR